MPGVINQNIYAPKFLSRRRNHVRTVRLVAEFGRDEPRPLLIVRRTVDLAGRRGQFHFRTSGEKHRSAFVRKQPCDRATNAAARTRDQRNAIFQKHRHTIELMRIEGREQTGKKRLAYRRS